MNEEEVDVKDFATGGFSFQLLRTSECVEFFNVRFEKQSSLA